MSDKDIIKALAEDAQINEDSLNDPDTASLFIHQNKMMNLKSVNGLVVETEEIKDGIKVSMLLKKGVQLKKPVHLCFGMIPKNGVQKIIMDVELEEDSEIKVLSHCSFPNAVDVKHIMDAKIKLGKHSKYNYLESHTHSPHGGVKVYPTAEVILEERAKFNTVFELLKGRVGLIDIKYKAICGDQSIAQMDSRIDGKGTDVIKISETAILQGNRSKSTLNSRVALRDNASAEVFSEIQALGDNSKGHVDCKEIVYGKDASARAVPIVSVKNPTAHVTHEAAIGSVDSKELQTLMSRGISESEAVEMIVQGMLKE